MGRWEWGRGWGGVVGTIPSFSNIYRVSTGIDRAWQVHTYIGRYVGGTDEIKDSIKLSRFYYIWVMGDEDGMDRLLPFAVIYPPIRCPARMSTTYLCTPTGPLPYKVITHM